MTESKGLIWLVGLASIIVIVAGLKAAEAITIPIMLALFIAIISTPFLRMLTTRGVPSGLAVLIVLMVLIVFGGGLAMVVSNSIDSFIQQLPQYQLRLQATLIEVQPILERMGIPLTREMLMQHVNPSNVMGTVGKALAAVGSLLTNVFLVVFIVIFLMMEEATFPRKMRAALPNANFTLEAATGFMSRVNKYLMIKTIISFITGVLVTLWLWFLGVDFPVLWGLVAMLMNYIPNVGSLIAAVPPVLLALVQLGFGDAALVALGFVVINVVMGSLIEPKYMGRGLGLSPLVVFLSLLIWGWLFGPVGMFLSIPLTMIVKIALEQYEGTKWIAIMLSNDAPEPAEQKETADQTQSTEQKPST
ncbi:AI-2E family transporter [Thiomicrospira sp. R3]|uniref:AI-2E family transporter n=1 Tax=Thiomicrospira sp. R3 TaxID=3035472 RepID=UPI00259BACC2|nr:AI-2E family transporter [Thiomicrospira sp. R3]WFE69183.1 AI-2E family transporter [Thiomicrospira sp. R3]